MIGVDWRVPLDDAWDARSAGDRGDPGEPGPRRRCSAPWDVVEREGARTCSTAPAAATGHVFNLGHGVLPDDAASSISQRLVELVHDETRERRRRSTGRRSGVLVMAYGTASGPDDIERYYTDIRGGRAPSPEHLAELKDRYAAIGNVFPLLDTTRRRPRDWSTRLNARRGRTVPRVPRDEALAAVHPRGRGTRCATTASSGRSGS